MSGWHVIVGMAYDGCARGCTAHLALTHITGGITSTTPSTGGTVGVVASATMVLLGAGVFLVVVFGTRFFYLHRGRDLTTMATLLLAIATIASVVALGPN